MSSFIIKLLCFCLFMIQASCGEDPKATPPPVTTDDGVKDPQSSQDDGSAKSNEPQSSSGNAPKPSAADAQAKLQAETKEGWTWPKDPLIIKLMVEVTQRPFGKAEPAQKMPEPVKTMGPEEEQQGPTKPETPKATQGPTRSETAEELAARRAAAEAKKPKTASAEPKQEQTKEPKPTAQQEETQAESEQPTQGPPVAPPLEEPQVAKTSTQGQPPKSSKPPLTLLEQLAAQKAATDAKRAARAEQPVATPSKGGADSMESLRKALEERGIRQATESEESEDSDEDFD